MKKTLFNKGFTLIEMLVVILIIVILSTVGMVAYSQATKSARDAKRRSDMESLKQALILYRQEVGNYPGGALTNVVTTLSSASNNYLSAGTSLSDPKPSWTAYSYRPDTGTATGFCACARLENNTKGNSSSGATSTTCNWAANDEYYCVSNP